MSFSVPSHLYRNRHGTFYFRHCIPQALRSIAGTSEVRFSLGTQDRQAAIIRALPLIADLPCLADCLQRMADTNETPPPDFFKLWQAQVQVSANLRANMSILKIQNDGYRDKMAEMVSKSKATHVIKQAHTLGQLKGTCNGSSLIKPKSGRIVYWVMCSISDQVKGFMKPIGRPMVCHSLAVEKL